MLEKYKLFGLQRTCTNVVLWLIKNNFQNIESVEVGGSWKHSLVVRELGLPIAILICTKDLYAWLPSCYNYFVGAKDQTNCINFQKHWEFNKFIRMPHYSWANPIRRYVEMNAYYMKWVQDHPERAIVMRSEDLLTNEDQAKQVKVLEEKFGWKLKGEIEWVEKRVNNNCTLHENVLNFNYYKNKEYMNMYLEADIEFVRQELVKGYE